MFHLQMIRNYKIFEVGRCFTFKLGQTTTARCFWTIPACKTKSIQVKKIMVIMIVIVNIIIIVVMIMVIMIVIVIIIIVVMVMVMVIMIHT